MPIKAAINIACLLLLTTTFYCSLNPVDKGATDTGNPGAELYSGSLCNNEQRTIRFLDGAGSDSGNYDLVRGQETAFNVYFEKGHFFSSPMVFTTNTEVCKDFSTCIRDTKAGSFNLLLSLSSNSSAPADSGTFYFDWAAFSRDKDISAVDFGDNQFSFTFPRGGGKTVTMLFNKKFGTTPMVFIANNSRSKDIVSSVSAVTTSGFDFNYCLSGNSSLPVDSGICSFSWMAVPKTCKATGIETGTGTIDYAMPRGGSASTDIVFNNGYNDIPVVIVSSTSIVRDMTINTFNKTKNGASVKITLSSNSSLPNDQGTYSFVWMAIARH